MLTDQAEACREYQKFKRACVGTHHILGLGAAPWLMSQRGLSGVGTVPKSPGAAPGDGNKPRNGALR